MTALKQQYELIKQLQLPQEQKKYSYDEALAIKVLYYMYIMFEIICQCDFLLRQQIIYKNQKSQADIKQKKHKFINKLKDINYTLTQSHQKIESLIRIIIKVRQQQILEKIKAEQFLWHQNNTDTIKHYFILKHFYMKIFRIRNYIHYNQRKIIQISGVHSSLSTNCNNSHFNIIQIYQNQHQFIEVQKKLDNIRRYLESSWIRDKGKGKRQVLQQLRRLAELVDRRQISNYWVLGAWSGVMLFMLVTIIFLFINYDINFNSEPQFQITFPIWRGMCYFVLILWSFGFQSYVFETYGVSFRMLTILHNYYIPKYPQLFSLAAFFTTLHLFMFMLYMLALAQFGITFPDNFQLHYLPAVSWILFIAFFCIPIPVFHAKKRLYPFFMIFRALFSPCLGTQFKFHWWTQIWVSFRQPFRDVIFTFRYYFIDSTILYENTIIYESLAGIFIYTLRIIQNIRQIRQNKHCGGMPFYGSIKCFLNMVTITISYLFRVDDKQLSSFLLFVWVISAIISTSYAYGFDIKYDWGLLQKSPEGRYMIRKRTVFGTTKLYSFVVVLNLLFRFIWVLNISPDILRQIPLERYLLILVVSSLQIIRRSIWSILRIENEHIIAQKYYESIGVVRQDEKQDKPAKNMLVEMGQLNKTFCIANQKAMNQIYEQCQQQITTSPNKQLSNKQKSHEQLQDIVNQKSASKKQIMDLLIYEMDEAHNSLHYLAEQAKYFIEDNKGVEKLNTSTQMFSERDYFY